MQQNLQTFFADLDAIGISIADAVLVGGILDTSGDLDIQKAHQGASNVSRAVRLPRKR